MAEGPSSKRMTPREIAAAIRNTAKQYGNSPRSEFLKALAGTIETGLTSTGHAEGRYGIVRSTNGVRVQCENAAQIGWVEVVCHTVKINFLTPYGRALERELHIT